MASLVVGTPWMQFRSRISGVAPPIFRQSYPPSSPLLLYYHPNNYFVYNNNNIRRCLSISSASSSSTEKDGVVRVRFAPSPTCNLHVGGARTALFNYLFARSKGGKFVLRIEDTGLERSTKESEEAMLQDLSWLGLDWDEGPGVGGDYGPYRQSERNALYKQYAEKLQKSGHVYRCFCSNEELEKMKEIAKLKQLPPVYSGKWASATDKEVQEELTKGTPFTYRFRVPKEGSLKIDDLIRGEVRWNLDTLGDFVIMRSNGQPVYNFCVTVDDATMAISHVIRAEEHLPNTLRQALIYEALGFPMPYFAHVSLILAPDRSKLSKRHGATSVGEFREIGYLPQAMVNYLALLGWGDGTENEFFTLEQLVEKFSIERVNKSGAVFDSTKFRWMNGQYLRFSIRRIHEAYWPTLEEHWHPHRIRGPIYRGGCSAAKGWGRLDNRFRESTFELSVLPSVCNSIKVLIAFTPPLPLTNFVRLLFFTENKNSAEGKPVLEDGLSEVGASLLAAYDTGELLDALEGKIGWQKWVKSFGKSLKCKGKSLFMPLRVLTGKLHGPDIGASVLLLHSAGTSNILASQIKFVTLEERFKLLREVEWESFKNN